MKTNKNNLGFTLIELTVAVLILAILSSMIINMINQSQARSQADLTKVKVFSGTVKNKLVDNLIGEWSFDENSGTTVNNTSNYGTLLNGTIYNATRKFGTDCVNANCLYFNGSTDYVDLAAGSSDGLATLNSITYPFTVDFWVNPTQNGVGMAIWGGYDSAGDTKNFIIINTSNQINFDQYTPSGGGFGLGPVITMNQWHHVAVSIASTTDYKLYVDGVLYTYATVETYAGGTPTQWNIGRRYMSTPSGYFKGYLDEVRVYNAALTTVEIQGQYFAGLNKLLAKGEITQQEYNRKVAAAQAETAQK